MLDALFGLVDVTPAAAAPLMPLLALTPAVVVGTTRVAVLIAVVLTTDAVLIKDRDLSLCLSRQGES